jgi:ribosomal protein S27AE
MNQDHLRCPGCGQGLDPAKHGDLICDGQVWCDRCHYYDAELLRPRDFQEIAAWGRFIAAAFGFDPIALEEDSDPALFRKSDSVVTAEADHARRAVCLYPPGLRLLTLCHEMAHIITGHDHTPRWAKTFACLVAWVKSRLSRDLGPAGFTPRLSVYAGLAPDLIKKS